MILPIRAYGDPVLREIGEPITQDYPELNELIESMFETMYYSSGVGIAAPQIGLAIRLFVIDTKPFTEEDEEEEPTDEKPIKRVFINAQKVEEKGEFWKFNEGCLSIPGVREDVNRQETLTLHYWDENWEEKTETFHGLAARVIQHEYDHIEGVLFTDYLSPFKKTLLKNKLNNIKIGKVNVDYKMRFNK